MGKKKLCILFALGLLLLCRPVFGEPVTGVSISASDRTLEVGDTVQYKATIKPSDAGNQSVTWSSSDKRVAEVDSNGYVVANRPGTCTIRVRTGEGSYSAAVTVTVSEKKISVSALSFKGYSHTMYLEDTYQIQFTIYPEKSTNQKVSWRTTDSSVASVSNGIVKGVGPGTCKIIGMTDDGHYEAAMQITVRPLPANTFTDIEKSKFRSNIILLSNQGVVNGYDGLYRPADPMTRAEFAAIAAKGLALTRSDSSRYFADVMESEWYYDVMMKAYDSRLITGYPDGQLHPQDTISLEEAVSALTRLFINEVQLGELPRSSKKFTCSDWATAYIDYAANNDIVDVSKMSKFNKKATRDEIAAIVYNVLKKQGRLSMPE